MKKQIKNRFMGVFGLFLVATTFVFLAVCVHPASAAAEKIVIKALSYMPIENKGAVGDVVYGKYIDTLNKKGKGELEVKYLGSSEVIPSRQQFEALKNGVVDMLYIPSGFYESFVPECFAVGSSEITPWEERESGFYDLMFNLHKKKAGVIYLGRAEYGVQFHIFSNKKIEKMADFKGLKFRSNASYDIFFKKFGVVTVELPGDEIYTAMERGLVVGFAMPVFITDRWHFQEVTKYRIDPGFWTSPTVMLMNQKKFESMPAHLQKLVLETAKEFERNEITPILKEFLTKEDKRQRDGGMQFINIPPNEKKQYLDILYGSRWERLARKVPKEEVEKIRKLVTKTK